MRAAATAIFAAMTLIWAMCRVDAQGVDRMLAIVDGQVVTAGDLAEYRALAAYFGEEDLPQDSGELLDRVIEDLLVRVQVARIPSLAATGEDIDALLAVFSPPPDLEFPLSEEALRQGARERIESQRYFRVRFRQSVSEDEIRNYYETVYAPEAAERGLGFSLEEVADVVEELALLEKIQRDAEEWAESLREDGLERGRIEIVE